MFLLNAFTSSGQPKTEKILWRIFTSISHPPPHVEVEETPKTKFFPALKTKQSYTKYHTQVSSYRNVFPSISPRTQSYTFLQQPFLTSELGCKFSTMLQTQPDDSATRGMRPRVTDISWLLLGKRSKDGKHLRVLRLQCVSFIQQLWDRLKQTST